MSSVNNEEKGRKQEAWTPTLSLFLGQLMVHRMRSARLGRSQPLIRWSFGSLCWVFHLSDCRDRVRQFSRWWSTPSAREQGRVSQIKHKAWYHHRGYARMLNHHLVYHWGRWNHERTHWRASLLQLSCCPMHRNQPSLPMKKREEKLHSTKLHQKKGGIFQKRGDDLKLVPTVNVKIVAKWHAVITLYYTCFNPESN